jgi:hypothetical protein
VPSFSKVSFPAHIHTHINVISIMKRSRTDMNRF